MFVGTISLLLIPYSLLPSPLLTLFLSLCPLHLSAPLPPPYLIYTVCPPSPSIPYPYLKAHGKTVESIFERLQAGPNFNREIIDKKCNAKIAERDLAECTFAPKYLTENSRIAPQRVSSSKTIPPPSPSRVHVYNSQRASTNRPTTPNKSAPVRPTTPTSTARPIRSSTPNSTARSSSLRLRASTSTSKAVKGVEVEVEDDKPPVSKVITRKSVASAKATREANNVSMSTEASEKDTEREREREREKEVEVVQPLPAETDNSMSLSLPVLTPISPSAISPSESSESFKVKQAVSQIQNKNKLISPTVSPIQAPMSPTSAVSVSVSPTKESTVSTSAHSSPAKSVPPSKLMEAYAMCRLPSTGSHSGSITPISTPLKLSSALPSPETDGQGQGQRYSGMEPEETSETIRQSVMAEAPESPAASLSDGSSFVSSSSCETSSYDSGVTIESPAASMSTADQEEEEEEEEECTITSSLEEKSINMDMGTTPYKTDSSTSKGIVKASQTSQNGHSGHSRSSLRDDDALKGKGKGKGKGATIVDGKKHLALDDV